MASLTTRESFPTSGLQVMHMVNCLSFEEWKAFLRKDYQRNHNNIVFDCLCRICLEALWEAGIEPSMRAIARCRVAKQTPMGLI